MCNLLASEALKTINRSQTEVFAFEYNVFSVYERVKLKVERWEKHNKFETKNEEGWGN